MILILKNVYNIYFFKNFPICLYVFHFTHPYMQNVGIYHIPHILDFRVYYLFTDLHLHFLQMMNCYLLCNRMHNHSPLHWKASFLDYIHILLVQCSLLLASKFFLPFICNLHTSFSFLIHFFQQFLQSSEPLNFHMHMYIQNLLSLI